MQSHDQLAKKLMARTSVLAKAARLERDDDALPDAQRLNTDLLGL